MDTTEHFCYIYQKRYNPHIIHFSGNNMANPGPQSNTDVLLQQFRALFGDDLFQKCVDEYPFEFGCARTYINRILKPNEIDLSHIQKIISWFNEERLTHFTLHKKAIPWFGHILKNCPLIKEAELCELERGDEIHFQNVFEVSGVRKVILNDGPNDTIKAIAKTLRNVSDVNVDVDSNKILTYGERCIASMEGLANTNVRTLSADYSLLTPAQFELFLNLIPKTCTEIKPHFAWGYDEKNPKEFELRKARVEAILEEQRKRLAPHEAGIYVPIDEDSQVKQYRFGNFLSRFAKNRDYTFLEAAIGDLIFSGFNGSYEIKIQLQDKINIFAKSAYNFINKGVPFPDPDVAQAALLHAPAPVVYGFKLDISDLSITGPNRNQKLSLKLP